VARLADPAASRVVLVGGARYTHLRALPTVANNVDELAAIFTDPELWGLPAGNCTVVRDPQSPQDIDTALAVAAGSVRPDGLLLFYFAGHGLIDPLTGALHLAVTGTNRNMVHSTATPFEWVRRWFLNAPAGARVVILDCCYSGRATEGMGEPAAIADEVEIDRTCVLVAAPANRTALAPPGERFTAFTGVLIDVMRAGLPGGPALLDMDTLYRRAEQTQHARNRPLPQLRARNGGERIPLVRNLAAVAGAGDEETGPPAPPPRIPLPRPGDVFTPTDELDYDEETGGPYGPVAVLAYDQRLGALGVRLGRPVQRPPGDVLGDRRLATALGPAEVRDGGPVSGVVLVVAELKRGARGIPGARRLSGSLVTLPLGTEPGLVAETVRRAWVFVGYLGWRPGQLEAELAQRALVPSPEPLTSWLDRQPLDRQAERP
jgi:putative AlgH/UPF0301 family transcriptional regulator